MLGREDIRASDRLAFDAVWFAEHMFGESLFKPRVMRKLLDAQRRAVRSRVARHLEKRGPGQVHQIDERESLTPEEFLGSYLSQARPVVLRGAARDWECCRKWSPQFFADTYGDDPVTLINLKSNWNEDHSTEESDLRTVIENMGSGVMKYARFVPLLALHPELLEHFDRELIRQFVGYEIKLWGESGHAVPLRSQLFIGEKGTTTSLHNAMTNNLFVQAYGEKKWVLIPPSYNAVINPPVTRAPGFFASFLNPLDPDPDEFAMFEHCDRYELTLEPGDLFYNPPFYWHHVSNPTDSIGVGIRWYWEKSALAASRTQNRLSFMATNPTMKEFLKQGDDFASNYAKTRPV